MAVKIPICWEKANVDKAISLKAKLDEKQTHYFMACHSSVKHIQDMRAGKLLSEDDLYQNIAGSGQRDIQAVIVGDQGTGKSHLIHWLKLRCDSELKSGVLNDVVPVLIQRRSGSLKDALEQMLVQLGGRFERHLDPVRQAIERISDDTARQMLANQLSVELGPGWKDRGRDPLPRLLRELSQACRAKGFGGWLCRDNGVIDLRIKLLTESSDVQERDSLPEFYEADFTIPSQFKGPRENSLEVLELIDELDDSKTLREEAAKLANTAMHDAIKDMIGLSGANLRTVFDAIRQDLQGDGKRLALFLEDVSVMAELDVEVVNALEPQDRHDLCPLTAVVGMTRTGHSHLRDNQKDRIEILACIDGDTTERWARNQTELARFTARYLNAIRLSEPEVLEIEKHRRESGNDIHISKCTSCEVKTECHNRFGQVRIGDVDVGLYPLTNIAPLRMLDHIESSETSGIAVNQRGLLIHVLTPILSDIQTIEEQRFPHDASLPIPVSDPIYWTEFTRNYCGGWDEDTRKRLRILAALWIADADTASKAAKRLMPLLEPLGFPSFSKEVLQTDGETETEGPKEEKGDSKRRQEKKGDKAAEKKVDQFLQNLRAWKNGEEKLSRDREFRRLVAKLIRRSIPWDSERYPPLSEWNRLLPQGKYEHIRIENQTSAPATTKFFIDFPRNEETRELLEALVRYEHLGKTSWNFSYGEHHKRITEGWIRTHAASIVSSLQPQLDTQAPVCTAIQFLCLIATVRKREKLPQSAANLVEEVFADRWESTPVTLSKRWTELVADMENRHEDARRFVSSELSIVQGRTGGINFIDPIPVIETATAFQKKATVEPVADDYFQSYWITRYVDGLSGGLQPYAMLAEVLDEERTEVGKLVEYATQMLASAGFDTTDLKSAFVALCEDLEQLVEVRKRNFTWPHRFFDELFTSGVFSEHRQRWGFALEKGERVSSSTDLYDILLFDPQHLKSAADALIVVATYIEQLDHELSLQEATVKEGGDPKELERRLIGALGTITDLVKLEQEETGVNS